MEHTLLQIVSIRPIVFQLSLLRTHPASQQLPYKQLLIIDLCNVIIMAAVSWCNRVITQKSESECSLLSIKLVIIALKRLWTFTYITWIGDNLNKIWFLYLVTGSLRIIMRRGNRAHKTAVILIVVSTKLRHTVPEKKNCPSKFTQCLFCVICV